MDIGESVPGSWPSQRKSEERSLALVGVLRDRLKRDSSLRGLRSE
jgi:hypothetical protein